MRLPNLYKLDSTGKIRVWMIKVEQDQSTGIWYYVQEHGVLNGKMQETRTAVKSGKNIGKANATTPEEQCGLEAKSLWKKQRDRKGYTDCVPTKKPMRPMLAKRFDEDGKHIVFPCYTQPKLDGFRCWTFLEGDQVVLQSRTGERWTILKHIEDALRPFFDQFPGIILDGELYNHDFKNDFQKLAGAIKRDTKNAESELMQYHVYDTVEEHAIYVDRLNLLLHGLQPDFNHIHLVVTQTAKSLEEAQEQIADYLADGYEGGMLRNKEGLYKINGRSKDLQKYKLFQDEEFEIVGAEECKGKQEGECTFVCKTKEGALFSVKPKGSSQLRRQYWADYLDGKLTGKMLTVRFFRWTTSNPSVPYAPVGIIIREDYE